MRVITEERLKEWLKHVDDLCIDDTWWIENDINQYMQEIDTLTVSKLRPMCEKPIIPEKKLQIFVMVYLNYTDVPVIVSFDTREKWPDDAYHGAGWVYLPTYKPE